MTVAIEVNGTRREVAAAPDTPLLWVLRDELRLTGAKLGCGIGLCGSCHCGDRLVCRDGPVFAAEEVFQ